MSKEFSFLQNEEVLRRFHSLKEVYKLIHENLNWDQYITLNDALLLEVSTAYYRDMKCYKKSTGTLVGDEYKKAAFVMKWITMLHPIQVAYFDGIEKKHLLSNTSFAIFAGLNMLNIDMKKISLKYYKYLLYFIQYRNISAIQFAGQLYLLEKAVNKAHP